MAKRHINVVPKDPTSYFDETALTGEVIAEHIAALSKGVHRLLNGPLKSTVIVTLLHATTKVPRKSIEKILVGLESMRSDYLNEPKDEKKGND